MQARTEGKPRGKCSASLKCVKHWGVSTCRPRARLLVLTETQRLRHPLRPPKSTAGLCPRPAPRHLPAVPAPQFLFVALPGAICASATPRAPQLARTQAPARVSGRVPRDGTGSGPACSCCLSEYGLKIVTIAWGRHGQWFLKRRAVCQPISPGGQQRQMVQSRTRARGRQARLSRGCLGTQSFQALATFVAALCSHPSPPVPRLGSPDPNFVA